MAQKVRGTMILVPDAIESSDGSMILIIDCGDSGAKTEAWVEGHDGAEPRWKVNLEFWTPSALKVPKRPG